jgi:hypothetical protein
MIKPNKSGEPTSRSYQATKEDFELWVNALIDEGYDLSEFTIDELYEGYEEFLGEDAAPEPKTRFTGIYGGGKIQKSPKEECEESFTPYEFWMNIIETQQPEATEEVVEEEIDEIVEEGPITSYQKWKQYLEEAPYTGAPVGKNAMIASNIARGSSPSSSSNTLPTKSTSTAQGPGTLEKVGSTLGAKVGGIIGQNRGASTGIPGAGTIGKVIGSNKGSAIGGTVGKAADTVVSSLRQSSSGGTSTRSGDGKPYADGPLWKSGGSSSPTPSRKSPPTSGGYSTREGDGKPRRPGDELWDGPSKTKPQPKKEAPNRNEPLW